MSGRWKIRVGESSINTECIEVFDDNGRLVCDDETYYPHAVTREHAELIVKAVNHYLDDLEAGREVTR